MRTINNLVLHCTATQPETTIAGIQNYWRTSLGWKSPGYHYIITPDGVVHSLQPIDKPSNGVAGHNANSIHISYVGGIDRTGLPKDTRTDLQKRAQIALLKELRGKFPAARILGHRDFPKVAKACPSFDVAAWLKTVGIDPKGR